MHASLPARLQARQTEFVSHCLAFLRQRHARGSTPPPLVLLGHSMGSIVARLAVQQLQRARDVENIVLLGMLASPGNLAAFTPMQSHQFLSFQGEDVSRGLRGVNSSSSSSSTGSGDGDNDTSAAGAAGAAEEAASHHVVPFMSLVSDALDEIYSDKPMAGWSHLHAQLSPQRLVMPMVDVPGVWATATHKVGEGCGGWASGEVAVAQTRPNLIPSPPPTSSAEHRLV